jgi:hypothetical protein
MVQHVREETVLFVSALLHTERLRRGTRALGCFKQAVLVIRWFLDGTRITQLATDNAIGRSTAYDYFYEGIDVLASQAPSLESTPKPENTRTTKKQSCHRPTTTGDSFQKAGNSGQC